MGNHRFCRCNACIVFKWTHGIVGDINIMVDGDLDVVFGQEMTAADKYEFNNNSEKFHGVVRMVLELNKENGGLFWGVTGLINSGTCPIDFYTELSDLLREFIQEEKTADQVVARLEVIKEEEVAENAREMTFEILSKIRSAYFFD